MLAKYFSIIRTNVLSVFSQRKYTFYVSVLINSHCIISTEASMLPTWELTNISKVEHFHLHLNDQGQLVVLEHFNKLFSPTFLPRGQYPLGFLRHGSNSLHWPYSIYKISSGNIPQEPIQSITSMRERGEREGGT